MITFGVIGADHRHIYHLIEGLLREGATCAGYLSASSDPKVVEGIQSRFPQIRAVDTAAELYDNPAIDLIVTAAIPSERADIAITAMRHGKDVLTENRVSPTAASCSRWKQPSRKPGGVLRSVSPSG